MRTITTMLILSGVLAHAAIAQASTTTADAGTTIAPAGQAAEASASAASDKPKAAKPRRHARAARATGADLRHCLDRKSNVATIRCTEGTK